MVLATGGIGKTFKITSNSWEYTGDGHALALLAGATLLNMEFVQFHPTHMVWPLSVAGLLVTESVRGDGGVLRNSEGKRFMFNYVPDVFRPMYAETEEEADRWYDDQANNRRPPELLPRDEVARSIRAEVKAGRGSPHGGVFLDIASRLPADEILRRLPSMYHQFKELADVDITKEPMEVGPAQHYVMGGVEVDPDTGAALGARAVRGRRGLRRHARLQPAGRQLTVGPAGVRPPGRRSARRITVAAARARGRRSRRRRWPRRRPRRSSRWSGSAARTRTRSTPRSSRHEQPGRHHPPRGRDQDCPRELEKLRERGAKVSAAGRQRLQPGLAPGARPAQHLVIAQCVAQAALERQESRGGHTRDDYPGMSPEWRKVNLICSLDADGGVTLRQQPMEPMRTDLLELFDMAELKKYMTEEELAGLPGAAETAAEETPPSAPPIGAPPGVLPEAGQKAPSSEAPARKAGE